MKTKSFGHLLGVLALAGLAACDSNRTTTADNSAVHDNEKAEMPARTEQAALTPQEMISRGEHLVISMGCDDCHSAKDMTDRGPVPRAAVRFAGHLATEKLAPYDAATLKNGWVLGSPSFTAWVGPWGTSFASNITPDSATGIGTWKEENFFRVMREGKYHGLENGRMILPPMPWPNFQHLTDDEIRSIFAYLMSVKPVKNQVPEPIPPQGARQS